MMPSTELYIFFLLFVLAVATTPIIQGCEPGEEEVRVANRTVNCRPCEENHFSSDGVKCQRCTACVGGQKAESDCYKDRDRYCLCPAGTFLHKNLCEKCSDCDNGWKQKSDCQSNKDRQCEQCPAGRTTNHTNARQCIPKKDNAGVTNHYTIKKADWVVITAVVCPIIVILLFVVIWCFVKRRRRRQKNAESSRPFLEDIPLDSIQTVNTAATPLRTLPASVIERMAVNLNGSIPHRKNWEHLAQNLGLSSHEIRNFKLRDNPCLELFSWICTEDRFDVNQLYIQLKSIRRHSTAALLLQE